jgi:hypothetical protein
MALKTSGNRVGWLTAIANEIMDGGEHPPSIDRIDLLISSHINTGINDGHVTAAIVYGEDRRADYRAGQRYIITEMVAVLREQGFVNGDDQALRWIKPLDGTWQVMLEDRPFTIRGQLERRLGHERNILGERDEKTGSITSEGMLLLGKHHPFEVEVIGPRGGTTRQSLQVHPFALAIPPMTEAERQVLRASIDRDGVKMPLVIFQKKVLDGRNRLYWASVLKKPVHIIEFTGTEEEAKREVLILNIHRRQLTRIQLAVVALQLFGQESRQEAAKAQEEGGFAGGRPSQNLPLKSEEGKKQKSAGEWDEIAARKARAAGMLNVTGNAIRLAEEVISAPNTMGKVDSGKIKQISEAVKQAKEEKGQPRPQSLQVDQKSAGRLLGYCIEHLKRVMSANTPAGELVDQLTWRLDEIERLVPEVRQAFRNRGWA